MQADASMRVHMLERELARAQKDIVALRCQLRCQPGSVTNPAVLRAAAAVSSGTHHVMAGPPLKVKALLGQPGSLSECAC